MSSKLIRTCLFAAGLAVAASFLAHAEPPTGGAGGDCGGPHKHGMFGGFDAEHLPPFLKSVKLSDEQRGKITEILKSQGQPLKDRFQAGRASHEALRKLAFSADYSEEKAKALSEEGAKSMAEIAQAHARLDHEIYLILTPEQQKQVTDWINSKDERRPRHHW